MQYGAAIDTFISYSGEQRCPRATYATKMGRTDNDIYVRFCCPNVDNLANLSFKGVASPILA
jgi:hypothetical protein